MNGAHLRAILWIRWRMLVNRVRRAGKLGNTMFTLLSLAIALLSIAAFVGCFEFGIHQFPDWTPFQILLVWSGLVLTFFFFWLIGLVTDLQRADSLSLQNLMHLPVSLHWAFLYNYFSSWVSLSIAVFGSAMLGLSLASFSLGFLPGIFSLLGLLAFLTMITAATYWLRGWLGILMQDKRHGRQVVTLLTFLFVLLVQLPNLINLRLNRGESYSQQIAGLKMGLAATEGLEGEAAETYRQQHQELEARLEELRRQQEQQREKIETYMHLGTELLPIGWLPCAASRSVKGELLAPIASLLGMFAIALFALRRSFHSTVEAFLRGGSAGRKGSRTDSGPPHSRAGNRREAKNWLTFKLPLLSEQTSAVACANLRSLSRAPEAKMLLLGPIILLLVMGVLLSSRPLPQGAREMAPLIAFGAISMGLLSIAQLAQNQFGLDRDGFRLLVLSPLRRDRILIGKNLSMAPLGLSLGGLTLLGVKYFFPLDLDHSLGACFQLVSAFLLSCLVGNLISILGPMRLKQNAWKADNPKWKTLFWQIAALVMIPLTFSPLMIPSGIEFLMRGSAWAHSLPLFTLMQAAELLLVIAAYSIIVRWQGDLLQEREQRMLLILTRS